MSKSESIKVAFRLRPLNSVEKQAGRKVCCIAHEDEGVIEMQTENGDSCKRFTFDAVFSSESSQRRIYDVCAAPVVQSVLEGFNGTVFAYGQTGAGKVSCFSSLYIVCPSFITLTSYLFHPDAHDGRKHHSQYL